MITYLSDSPEQTCQLAKFLSAQLKPGDVILLTGDVGAGKSHFARCLIQASLHQPEDIPSPTFTLVQTYNARHSEIWHADLYRLTDTTEIEELGLIQAFDDAICLVEWPDRLADLAPASALSVALDPGADDDARVIRFNWTSDHWTPLMKGLLNA
ncbi:MAG: tRNA (adenosine(37)-N6)-threonylcarbamoyltransferase complex ATPase subunit type 1 TsaE [Roseovarius sp.]|nr:tRNA (adenosine(37)-N6)-threonylcarbamoyltransferase complex ATPase subunit type 1 TsaE [Roseovarius sp.]